MADEKPKVMETGIAGIVAALAVWAWNKHQLNTMGDWEVVEPISGMMVALVAFVAGPALRAYSNMWGGNSKSDLVILAEQVEVLAGEVKKIKSGGS